MMTSRFHFKWIYSQFIACTEQSAAVPPDSCLTAPSRMLGGGAGPNYVLHKVGGLGFRGGGALWWWRDWGCVCARKSSF